MLSLQHLSEHGRINVHQRLLTAACAAPSQPLSNYEPWICAHCKKGFNSGRAFHEHLMEEWRNAMRKQKEYVGRLVSICTRRTCRDYDTWTRSSRQNDVAAQCQSKHSDISGLRYPVLQQNYLWNVQNIRVISLSLLSAELRIEFNIIIMAH